MTFFKKNFGHPHPLEGDVGELLCEIIPCAEKVRKDYPEVESEKCHVDALAMNFVCKTDAYDVVVADSP